jgi:hypothetical protein
MIRSMAVTAWMLPDAEARQVTGVLGRPSATTTIDGKQLPPPPPKFGGVIKVIYEGPKPWCSTVGCFLEFGLIPQRPHWLQLVRCVERTN